MSRSKKPFATKAESLLSGSTFYADHCLGSSLIEGLRACELTVERHLDHFAHDCPDAEWIPVVASRGWIVLTKDKMIRLNAPEIGAVIECKLGVFTLGNGRMNGGDMLQVFRDNLLNMGRVMKKQRPPFIAAVNRSGVQLRYPKQEK